MHTIAEIDAMRTETMEWVTRMAAEIFDELYGRSDWTRHEVNTTSLPRIVCFPEPGRAYHVGVDFTPTGVLVYGGSATTSWKRDLPGFPDIDSILNQLDA